MDLTVRFVEIPLQGGKLADQTAAVRDRASLRKAEMNPVALSMMCAAVGRRLRRREVAGIGDALEETMRGELDGDGIAEGDAYAQVFGEVLGPLFTCLERGGDLEVIRLLPPTRRGKQQRRADVLILDRGRKGVMLQECKGHCPDYFDVKDDPECLEICRALRKHRNAGRKQLAWPDAAQITDRRVQIVGGVAPPQLPVPHAEQSVVATAVPDGRLRSSGLPVTATGPGCPEPCTSCLFSPNPALVTVLASERLEDTQTLTEDGLTFLDWYKSCERAIWGQGHGSFGSTLGHLVAAWRQSDLGREAEVAALPFLMGLIQEAQRQRVFVDTESVSQACSNVDMPESLQSYLHDIHRMQADMPPPPVRQGSAAQLGTMLFGREGEPPSDEAIHGNWLMHLGGERAGRSGDGTPSEAHIARPAGGPMQAVLIPRRPHDENTVDDLCWGIAEILAAGRVPTEVVYDGFVEERVVWRNAEGGERREFRLGKSLWAPWWPFWPWGLGPRALEEMRRCCPHCDMLAHELERFWRHWPEPFQFDRHFWRHHHRHHRFRTESDAWSEPAAFVTYDGRAMLNLPGVS